MTESIYTNLGLAAKIVFGLVYTIWIIHLIIKDASIVDLIWGAGFGLVAGFLIYSIPNPTGYQKLLAALPIIWSIRYTVFIFRRNFGNGEDDRYTKLREEVAEKGQNWILVSFLRIYTFQGLAMLLVCAPLIIGMANPEANVTILSIVGAVIWLIGFIFETVADIQLNTFKAKNKDYDGPYATKPLLTTGIWKYSRHPNYFGNASMWWGIGIVALSAPYGWIGLIGSAFMNFTLVSITGKANNESKMINRTDYQNYIEKTSGFFPLPPK